MNGPAAAAVQTQAATAAVTTDRPEATVAAASSQLKRLAETLDRHGIRSAAEIGAQLQLLAQQLLQLQQASTAASAQQPTAPKLISHTTPAGVDGQTTVPTAADLAALERSYAAPAAAGTANADEAGETQPLTKKQRRGENLCLETFHGYACKQMGASMAHTCSALRA